MAHIYGIVNQKGGVGKSTTAQALSEGLALRGCRTLLVDLDPQCNSSHTLRAKTDGITVLDVLKGAVDSRAAIQRSALVDVLAASRALSGADAFLSDTGKEYRLKEALEPLGEEYACIVVDTPPALGVLTVNALTACGSVVIPAQADLYSLQGVEQLWETMRPVRRYCNAGLAIDGILLTRYSPRSVLSRDAASLAERLAAKMGTRVFRTAVREAVAVKEAQIRCESLFTYAPRAKVTEDYRKFIDELTKENECHG